MPERLRLPLRRQAAAVHVDGAEAVVRLVDDENLRRGLHDLQRLRVDMVLERALGQAQPVGIVEAALRGAPFLQLGGPWLKRQTVLEPRAGVAAAHLRRAASHVGLLIRHPDAGEIRLAVGRPRRRRRQIRFTVRASRDAGGLMRGPLRRHRAGQDDESCQRRERPCHVASFAGEARIVARLFGWSRWNHGLRAAPNAVPSSAVTTRLSSVGRRVRS